MDMKKILAAFDGAASKPAVGTNDMKKFLSIVSENVATKEAVITSFDEDSIGGQANQFLISADNINDMVMAEVDKIKINADPELLKDMMDKFNQFMTAYHSVGKEILQPDMFKDDVNEKITIDQSPNTKPQSSDNSLKVGQMVKFGLWQKPQEHQIGKIVSISEPGYEVVVDVDGKQIKLNRANKSLVIHPVKDDQAVGEGAAEDLAAIEKHPAADDPRIQRAVADKKKELGTKEGVHNGLAFKDYFALEEAKKTLKNSNPCWKGYKPVGTKEKNGKTVPNCVPKK